MAACSRPSVVGAVAAALACFWTLWAGEAASAHSMPNSIVTLDFGAEAVRARMTLPWAELRYSLGKSESAPTQLDPALRAQLENYLKARVSAHSPDGRLWSTAVERIALERNSEHADIIADITISPPSGLRSEQIIFRDTAVSDVVMSHVILVFVRNDYAAGLLDEAPRLVGALQNPVRDLPISTGAAEQRGSFWPALRLGSRHILGGADHLLFLFTLLLPAPLLAERGRWAGRRPAREALYRLFAIVSAFTIGHSITLIVAAAFTLKFPEQPVEILIAFSILAAALAAWRPLAPDGRASIAIAIGFGLMHGLAFSSSISDALLPPWQKAQAIAGFNIGIELVQILLVAFLAPLLLYLARWPAYRYARMGGALAAAFAAIVWVAARSMPS